MTAPAIQVEGIGKLYRLGHLGHRHDSFRAALTAMATAPFRRLRRLSGSDETMEEFWALRNVSFEVPRGEVIGVIGRNGAGKSTLLKILSRIVEPTEGRAVMRGRVASLLEVGTGFHPELSGRENIYLNGSILGMRRREIDSKFDEIVAFAEVEKFLDTPVKWYSSGMYVRLAFAVASHLEPEILIVDEVLAVGDSQFQKKCLGKMKDIAGGGDRTVVFVSHNMGAVRALCSSCIHMVRGRVDSQGPVDGIINQYLKPERENRRAAVHSKHGLRLFSAGLYRAGGGEEADNVVYFLDPCEIRVRISAPRGFASTALVVHVFDELGNHVSSLNSTEEGVEAFTLEGPRTFVYPVSRMSLMPGRYTVSIMVHRPHDATRYLDADSYFEFEVLPALVPGGLLPYTKDHGVARFVDGCRVI
ncbi:MAG TPA: ABC transporter ATP-binding protein [Caldimonas sp.]|nr:ABC transporter ATP-binding protein [Caldimonas sp.]